MAMVTGTPDTRTEHSQAASVLSVIVAAGIPLLLAVAGLSAFGWDAISWGGAIIWGAIAAVVMAFVVAAGRSMGMTRMRLTNLLGSAVAEPDSSAARAMGWVIHLAMGALLAVAWLYTMELFGWPATWFSGLLWGGFVSLLALLLFSSLGAIHPAIRRGEEEDPGPGATNFGRMTPVGVIGAHLVYGLVLGGMYQWIPMA